METPAAPPATPPAESSGPMGYVLAVVVALLLLAILPSMIAQEKGRSMKTWYAYSFLAFPVALIHSFFLKAREEQEKCSKCKKPISVLALECPHCGARMVFDI